MEDDAARIAQIQVQSWTALHELSPTASLADALPASAAQEAWQLAVSTPPDRRHRVLAACRGAHVVGFAAFGPDPGGVHLHVLEVAPDERRQGHGSRLLAAVVDLARQGGAGQLGVWALEGDAGREAFLAGAGLAPAGLRRRLETPGPEPLHEILWTAAL